MSNLGATVRDPVAVGMRVRWLLAPLALLLLFASLSAPGLKIGSAAGGIPAFDHIFLIVMENHSYSQIIGHAPYIDSLAASNGLATNYRAITHPSLPNYITMIGGSQLGITDNCTSCSINAPNLAADRISPSGRTWKAYQEGMPSTCFTGASSGRYVKRHNPFMYFENIRNVPAQCANVVPYTRLATDLGSASTTPNFGFITPDLCNDMHDCSIATGDNWLRANVPPILNSPAFVNQNSALFILFDEDNGSEGNRVVNLVISRSTPAGARSNVAYNHYSLLRTIEQAWGLAPLTTNDGNASAMADLFGGTPGPTSTPTNTLVPTSTPTSTATLPVTVTPTAGATSTATSVPPTGTATSVASTATPTRTPTAVPSPTATPPPGVSPFPIRAAFFYPWFPNSWTQGGVFPYTQFHPSLGYYDSANDAAIYAQLLLAERAHLDAFIGSWWGQSHWTNTAMQHIVPRTSAIGSPIKWSVYYEQEGQVDPSVAQIVADMTYLGSTLFNQPNYLRVGGKPVVFVYANGADNATMNARWAQAKAQLGGNLYVVLKVHANYRTDANQPDSWHQYGPAAAIDRQLPYSVSVSPGFWKSGEAPRLARNPTTFEANVTSMVASGAAWHLITTWNEWGEGSTIEPATEYGMTYIDILGRH